MVKLRRDAKIRCDVHEDTTLEFIAEPDAPRNHMRVSSVRLQMRNATHALLRFWNRGAETGNWVVVKTEDAFPLAARLLGVTEKALVESVDVGQVLASLGIPEGG